MNDALRAVLTSDPRIAYALLFGSRARDQNHEGSDADVAIGLSEGATLSPRDLLELASRLESAAGRPVDLVLLAEAPPGLAFRIFRDGVFLAVKDGEALAHRPAQAVLEYIDYRPIEELLTRGVLKKAADGR
jgi:predicted nucleotidyltransferase